MTIDDIKDITCGIINRARLLSSKYTDQRDAPVNYACIFSQSTSEFNELLDVVRQFGRVAQETPAGPVFEISPISTVAGELNLLKIRRPDPKRPERGDADFTVADYPTFKSTYLGQPGFDLIQRPEMEMIELADSAFDVLAYYSHPTLAEVLRTRDS